MTYDIKPLRAECYRLKGNEIVHLLRFPNCSPELSLDYSHWLYRNAGRAHTFLLSFLTYSIVIYLYMYIYKVDQYLVKHIEGHKLIR